MAVSPQNQLVLPSDTATVWQPFLETLDTRQQEALRQTILLMEERERFLLNQLGTGRWASYTPSLTSLLGNPTLGTGSSQFGTYTRFGRTVLGTAQISFGDAGTAPGGAGYEISLPVPRQAKPPASGSTFWVIGFGYIYDVSAAARWNVIADVNPAAASTTCNLSFTAGGGNFYVGGTTPFTFGASDQLTICFMYDGSDLT